MLSEDEIQALTQVAGLIIPASTAYGVPGADDPSVMAAIVISANREENSVRAALTAFSASGEAGKDASFQTTHPVEASVLQTIVASCYYRDARVLKSLGRNAEPPFPKGFDVAKGDFSLLDPVRTRGPIWRKV